MFSTPKESEFIKTMREAGAPDAAVCPACIELRENIRINALAKKDKLKGVKELWREKVVEYIRCDACTDKLTQGLKWVTCPKCKNDWSALLCGGSPTRNGQGLCPDCIREIVEEKKKFEVKQEKKEFEKNRKPYWNDN